MTERQPLSLFEGYGIELEYMVVDRESLEVRPIVDRVLAQAGAGEELEVSLGEVAISNELALHVLEFKTDGPSPALAGLGATFQRYLAKVQPWLAEHGAQLLPTGMHPWMNPATDFQLWPHGDRTIYEAFDRLFGCKGHGWSNLQSMHVNLPFRDDEEFGRLHAAVRLLLPLLPGLAASSPFMEGAYTGLFDTRLSVYWNNARPVPSISGQVVPEAVFTRADYEQVILDRIYRDMAPLDPDGVLRHEWVNARGCIARFERMALEIRVLDVQECPAADLAIAAAVVSVLKAMVEERWSSTASQQAFSTEHLAALLQTTLRQAEQSVIDDGPLLAAFGFPRSGPVRLGELWQHLVAETLTQDPNYEEWRGPLQVILQQGCLARRVAQAVGPTPTPEGLLRTYRALAECLQQGISFQGC